MRCQICNGSGTVMGLGMTYKDCQCLDNKEDEIKPINPKPLQIDKRSKAYREAIAEIMRKSDMGREEAVELFEKEFYKVM